MQSRMEQFKEFVKRHPSLRDEVRKNSRTWQSIYEEWVIYGEDDSMWEEYRLNEDDPISLEGSGMDNVKNIVSYIQKLNPEKLQKTLNSFQKIIQIAQSVTGSKKQAPNQFGHHQNTMYNDWWD